MKTTMLKKQYNIFFMIGLVNLCTAQFNTDLNSLYPTGAFTNSDTYLINSDPQNGQTETALKLITKTTSNQYNHLGLENSDISNSLNINNLRMSSFAGANRWKKGRSLFSFEGNGDFWLHGSSSTVHGTIKWDNIKGLRLDFGWVGAYGIGVQSSTQYFRTVNNFVWYKGGSHNNELFDNGCGTTLMTLNQSGGLGIGRNIDFGDLNSDTSKDLRWRLDKYGIRKTSRT